MKMKRKDYLATWRKRNLKKSQNQEVWHLHPGRNNLQAQEITLATPNPRSQKRQEDRWPTTILPFVPPSKRHPCSTPLRKKLKAQRKQQKNCGLGRCCSKTTGMRRIWIWASAA